MKAFLDIDGVLANWHKAAWRIHGIGNPYLIPENLGIYGLSTVLNMPKEDLFRPMGEEFYASLELMDDAHQILASVEGVFGDVNICLLSAPIETRGCIEGKMQWVRKHFPEYSSRLFIGSEKYFFASPNTILIDDYDKNIAEFRKHTGKGILLSRPWNSGYKDNTIDKLQKDLYYL